MPTKKPIIRLHDIIIALCLGIIFTLISAWIVSPHLIGSSSQLPYIAPNFGDYCEYLGLWDVQDVVQQNRNQPQTDSESIDFLHPGRRTMVASLPGRIFVSIFGVIDGLAAGALLCSVIFASSLYLWTATIYGRFAGIISVIAAMSTGSLCLITRHFTFYPTIVASFALSAATTAIAIRNQHRWGAAYLFAGVSIGVSLLVDVRGLIWVGICIPFVCMGALSQRGYRFKIRNIFLFLLPLWGSFQLGPWNTGRLKPVSLEEQVDIRPLAYTQGARTEAFSPPYSYPGSYSWGNSPIKKLPLTFHFLLQQLQMELPQKILKVRKTETRLYKKRVQIWEHISFFCLIISLLVLRKDRWAFFTLLVTGIPYVIAQLGIHTQHEFRVRFLFHTLPLTCVVMGITGAKTLYTLHQILGKFGISSAVLPHHFPQRKPMIFALLGAGCIAILLNICAITYGPLHPRSKWRGGRWIISHGHIYNLKGLLEGLEQETQLDINPSSIPNGLSKRWIFRKQTCVPLLILDRQKKENIFASSFYPPLRALSGRQPTKQGIDPRPATPSQITIPLSKPEVTQPPTNFESNQPLPPLDEKPTKPAEFTSP